MDVKHDISQKRKFGTFIRKTLFLPDKVSDKSMGEGSPKDVPKHFKSYSIQDRDIFCEKATRIVDTYDDGVYERPMKVKEVNLVEPRETPKPIFVLVDLTTEEEGDLIALLKEYED